MLEYDINLEELIKNPNVERLSDQLDLFKIKNVLNENQCSEMIKLIREKCQPSTVMDAEKNANTIHDHRTSSTAYLYRTTAPIVNDVEDAILKAVPIQEKFSESVQGQYYQVGQQFKPHFDTFFPTNDSYKDLIDNGGNRSWTAMVYLNNVPKGGHTRFTKIELDVVPEMGALVLWRNTLNGENILNSMHWGMPVEEGEKFVLTKWFRNKAHRTDLK